MIYKEARRLRDLIRADGGHCVIPRGHGPRGHFLRTVVRGQPFDLMDAEEVGIYLEESAKHRKAAELAALRLTMPRPRSPLELMIDKACGLA